MVDAQAAQRGVLEAIWNLHHDGTFTAIINDLWTSVFPKYLAIETPAFEESSFYDPGREPTMAPYVSTWRKREPRRLEFEDALRAWVRRFRLTADLTETGDCLLWVLDFGRALCEGRPAIGAPEPRTAARMPPPWGMARLDEPNPAAESRSDWLRRIEPTLYDHYAAVRKRQRSRPYVESRRDCRSALASATTIRCRPQPTANVQNEPGVVVRLTLRRIGKGIASVRGALGLGRK
jgi:hypothetical protein